MKLVADQLDIWLKSHIQSSGLKGFVVGVSGGIDSAVVSTLCARTGYPTITVALPIYPNLSERGITHISWLLTSYTNVFKRYIDLTYVYDQFLNYLQDTEHKFSNAIKAPLVGANLQSRLRMCALYAYANAHSSLVVGTGNKVEDFGIGFFTKGGDGMVDISPIGDLLKSEVRKLAEYLGINPEIINAAPTDGLWEDGRTDEDQIGASYDELEWAMAAHSIIMDYDEFPDLADRIKSAETSLRAKLSERQKEVLEIYHKRHTANRHKMAMPPICPIQFSPDCEVMHEELEF